jgi:hypothetical protein
MLTNQLKDVLINKNRLDGSLSSERISYRKVSMSAATIEQINQAGLADQVDDYIEVEQDFKVKKIGKFY